MKRIIKSNYSIYDMKLIKQGAFEVSEKLGVDSYGSIYQIDDLTQKIVTIADIDVYEKEILGELESDKKATLEIRINDYDVDFNKLIFYEGKLSSMQDQYELRLVKNMPDRASVLKWFADEFKDIFEINEKLKEYLPYFFKELNDYF